MNIKTERTRHGWSQEYVAQQVGLTRTAIHAIEQGKRQPSYPTYQKLMSLFGFNVPRLVFGEPSGEPSKLVESIPLTVTPDYTKDSEQL